MSKEEVKRLSPEKIASVAVLKDSVAVAKYGEKGRYGVFVITTKK